MTTTTFRAKDRVQSTHQGKLEWVSVRHAEVDPRAQGVFNQARADKIAAEFDPDALGYPFVWATPSDTIPNGWKYYIIDGQHRFAAVRQLWPNEDQKLQCEVVRDITIQRAAELFRLRNRTRVPRAVDKFLTGVTAADPVCVAINKLVLGAHLHVSRKPSDGALSCVVALERIYKMDAQQGLILGRVLEVATLAWGRRSDSSSGDVLVGLGMVLRRYPEIEDSTLIKKLTGHVGGSMGILGRARTLKSAHGGELALSVARAIIMAYNVARRIKLTDWDADTPRSLARRTRRLREGNDTAILN